MAKKSKLLAEIGEQMKNLTTVKIEELNIDILNAMSRKFMDLEDERDSRYGLHEVSEIVMITFLGLLAKCNEWEEIYLFGVEHYDWLKTFLNLHYGLPSKSTMMRVMAMIDSKDLEKICVEFILEKISKIEKKLHIENKRDVITLDGKKCNSSSRKSSKNGKIKSVQAMSAYSNKYDMTLATEFIEDKTNEIPMTPIILSRLDLSNTIITFDALNTQKDTISYIIKNNGDYIAPIKANQGNLYQDLIDYFNIKELKNRASYYVEKEKNHSQIETRKYSLTSDVEWISYKKEWRNLTSIGIVEKISENLITGEVITEIRYYITSLYDNEIKDFAEAVRNEWAIENNLHWHLDFTFKEDKNLVSQKRAQQNLNILRKLSLNILKIAQPSYGLSLKNIRFKLCMNFEQEIIKILSLLNVDSVIDLIRH